MTLHTINDDLQFICNVYQTRYSWGHRVVALYKGRSIDEVKVRYYNRTWERYTFESAMYHMIDKLDKSQVVPLHDRISAYKFVKYGVIK